jgi:hypothetical protein
MPDPAVCAWHRGLLFYCNVVISLTNVTVPGDTSSFGFIVGFRFATTRRTIGDGLKATVTVLCFFVEHDVTLRLLRQCFCVEASADQCVLCCWNESTRELAYLLPDCFRLAAIHSSDISLVVVAPYLETTCTRPEPELHEGLITDRAEGRAWQVIVSSMPTGFLAFCAITAVRGWQHFVVSRTASMTPNVVENNVDVLYSNRTWDQRVCSHKTSSLLVLPVTILAKFGGNSAGVFLLPSFRSCCLMS